eukprot:augustus_masked-scaffold_46-processed-gene-1.116-mRNA-1 protein AED:1.00 eAED:1.00 QI:0/0/0/0/1/1/2/0/434
MERREAEENSGAQSKPAFTIDLRGVPETPGMVAHREKVWEKCRLEGKPLYSEWENKLRYDENYRIPRHAHRKVSDFTFEAYVHGSGPPEISKNPFEFNSECEMINECSNVFDPVGQPEVLKVQPFKNAEFKCLQNKVNTNYRLERKKYCPSWSEGVGSIYGYYMTMSDHPNALPDFLGCVLQWTREGRYSRYKDECYQVEKVRYIDRQKVSEFDYVTHFLNHMFMKHHQNSLVIFHINWYRFHYCPSRGNSFKFEAYLKAGKGKIYETTVPSDTQFGMNLVKLDSYKLNVANFDMLGDLAEAITFAFKKRGILKKQIKDANCISWDLGVYNRRTVYEWKRQYHSVVKAYYKAAWRIPENIIIEPARLATLTNTAYLSSIIGNQYSVDEEEAKCLAVRSDYYTCDLQCGSAGRIEWMSKRIYAVQLAILCVLNHF